MRLSTREASLGLECQRREKATMLWKIFVVALLLWMLGFAFQIGGSLIHILLVVAFVVLIWNLIATKRRFA